MPVAQQLRGQQSTLSGAYHLNRSATDTKSPATALTTPQSKQGVVIQCDLSVICVI